MDQNSTTQNKENMSDAEKWQRRFHFAEQAQRSLFKRAEKNYDILYAVFNTDNVAPWRSKVYVPTLASKAWDLIARLSEIQPDFMVNIENELAEGPNGEVALAPDVETRVEKIEDKLEDDYCHTPGEPMKLKTFNTLADSVVAGTGFAKVPWTVQKKKRRARPVDELGMVDLSQEIVKESEEGQNDFQPINFFNMFIAPNSASFFTAPYIIERIFTTKQQAKDSGLYDDKKIDSLVESNQNASQFSIYNQSRNRVMNTRDQNDQTIDNIVLYECQDLTGTVWTFGEGPGNGADKTEQNSWLQVKKQVDQYWHGTYNVVPFYIRKKSFSPFGESIFENNSRLQSAVNDLFNHYLDNWNLSIDSMLMYEDNSLQNDFVVEPGGEIIYSGEKPTQFKFPEPNPQQLSVVMGVLNQAIEAATVPQYLSGVPDSSLDKTQGTATGVKNITDAATEKVGFMRDNFKQSMKLVGNIWLSNLQQFMDKPAQINTVKRGVKTPKILMPGEVQGEMSVEIDDDSMVPITKEARKATYKDLIENLGGLQKLAVQQYEITQDKSDVPRMAWAEIAEDLVDQYAVKDAFKYFKPDDPQQDQPEQKGPSQKMIESINYKDLPPDAQQAMLKEAGLNPSPIVAAQAQQQMSDAQLGAAANQTAGQIAGAPQGTPNG